jgi:hypothetical protein
MDGRAAILSLQVKVNSLCISTYNVMISPLCVHFTQQVQRTLKEIPQLETSVKTCDSLYWLRTGVQNFHDVSLLERDGIDVIRWKILRCHENIAHLQREEDGFGTAVSSTV